MEILSAPSPKYMLLILHLPAITQLPCANLPPGQTAPLLCPTLQPDFEDANRIVSPAPLNTSTGVSSALATSPLSFPACPLPPALQSDTASFPFLVLCTLPLQMLFPLLNRLLPTYAIPPPSPRPLLPQLLQAPVVNPPLGLCTFPSEHCIQSALQHSPGSPAPRSISFQIKPPAAGYYLDTGPESRLNLSLLCSSKAISLFE